jgi:hypothetical protein
MTVTTFILDIVSIVTDERANITEPRMHNTNQSAPRTSCLNFGFYAHVEILKSNVA